MASLSQTSVAAGYVIGIATAVDLTVEVVRIIFLREGVIPLVQVVCQLIHGTHPISVQTFLMSQAVRNIPTEAAAAGAAILRQVCLPVPINSVRKERILSFLISC
jgi:hypothetical protein